MKTLRKRQIIKHAGRYGKHYPKWLEAHAENADTQIPFPVMLNWYRKSPKKLASNGE